MSYDIVADRQGVIEVRARTPAYADYLYGLLLKHHQSVTRDRTNARVLFLKDPHVEGFRTADQLLTPEQAVQRRLIDAQSQEG